MLALLVAAVLNFSGTGTSGEADLAAASTWGGTDAPQTGDTLNIGAGDCTFTASKDLEVANIYIAKGGATNLFELDAGRRVTVTGQFTPGPNSAYRDILTTLSGGIWDFAGSGKLAAVYHYSYGTINNHLLLSGTTVTNLNAFQVAYTREGSSVFVRDGSMVYLANDQTRVRDAGTRGSVFEVSGGSRFEICSEAQGNFAFANNCYCTTNLFIGGGTLFTNASSKAEVISGGTNLFRVAEGAKVVLSGPYLFQSDSHESRIEVESGGEFHSRGAVYFNQGTPAHDNCLSVSDGGRLVCDHLFYLGGTNSELSVSGRDSVFSATGVMIQGADNRVRVDDADTRFSGDISIYIGRDNDPHPVTNAEFIITGRSPSVECDGTLYLKNGGRLVFDVPPEGYSSRKPLLSAKNFSNVDGTGRIELRGVDFTTALTTNDTEIVLMAVNTNSNGRLNGLVNGDRLRELRDGLPSWCELELSGDGRELVLRTFPAYDLHTRALVPIVESAAESDDALPLVTNGVCNFAIAWNVGCENHCGTYKPTTASIMQALPVLTNAFYHTFGVVTPVIDAKDSAAVAAYPYVLALGASPVTAALGYDPVTQPESGYTIATHGRLLVLHGNDSSQDPSYNAEPYGRRSSSWGTLWAAIDFTERFLGARYFFPGDWGTLWKPRKNLVIRPVRYSDRPRFRNRGSLSHFNRTYMDDALTNKWTRLLGANAVKWGDGSFVRLWRQGNAGATAGSHAPDPQKYGARHLDLVEQVFYRNPYGYLSWFPESHYPNIFNVVDLSTVDRWMEDIHAQFAEPQPYWDTWGWPTLSTTYVPFGQCDTAPQTIDFVFNPTVRELGLINPVDLERARQPDGYLRNENGLFANIYGRFVRYYAEKVAAELPGEKLYLLVYHASKFPPNDPRYALPANVEVCFCDHRLPRRLLNADDRADILRIAREWYVALGNRPVKRVWLYNSSNDPFTRAICPEFTAEVPKAFGELLGEDMCFFDCNGADDLYHHYFAHYVSHLSQWNPDFDIEAALDEHWPLFYGKTCGAYLKEFHDLLKTNVIELCGARAGLTEEEKYSTPLSAATVDRLEELLSLAGEAVEKGTDYERRYDVFAYPWPEAFAKRRVAITNTYVYSEAERAKWKKKDMRIDSMYPVYTRYHLNPDPYVGNRSQIDLEFANALTRYTFKVVMSDTKVDGTPGRQSFSVLQGRTTAGFGYADVPVIVVNGTSWKDVEIAPENITPWASADGRERGYELALNFANAPMILRISLRASRRTLDFELRPDAGAAVSSASVELSAIPSAFETGNGLSRFYNYRKRMVTATRTYDGVSGVRTPIPVTAADRYFVFEDLDYDGSSVTNGVGPCALAIDFAAVDSATASVNDFWKAGVTAKLRPDFSSFGFKLYEDRDRRVTNDAFRPPAFDRWLGTMFLLTDH